MIKVTDQLQSFCNKIYRWIPQPDPSARDLKNIQIVAHRGCWNDKERLENTMAAFLASLRHDIWGIEFDIRWTQDNVPVIHHDTTTERVFGKDILINQISFKNLRSELAQIPTLQELINIMGTKKHFMIELKTTPSVEQVEILSSLLKPLTPEVDFHFISLDLDRFIPLSQYSPKCFVSIARTNMHKIFKESLRRELGGVTGQYLLLTDSMTKQCHANGIKVGTGFPDSQNLFFRETNRQVDWVFTNQAALLATYKKS